MSSTAVLRAIVAKAGSIEWQPPASVSEPNGFDEKPASIEQIETELGLELLKPGIGSELIKSSWFDDSQTTYYASLGRRAVTSYKFAGNSASESLKFAIIQREVLATNHPVMYLYPQRVDASLISLRGYEAVVWSMPPNDTLYSYVDLFTPGRVTEVLFPGGTKRDMMIKLVETLV